MCGRFSLFAPLEDLEERFEATFSYPYERTYNAAPGQFLPVITDERPEQIQASKWGLVPTWADDDSHAPINARAETAAEKPTFRESFSGVDSTTSDADGEAAGRCLVLADGFYEWAETDAGKQPYRITRVDDEPFALAGLWTRWRPPATQTGLDAFAEDGPDDEPEPVATFTILTTEPNDVVAPLHDRMAVVLDPGDERTWLTAAPEEAQQLLEPCPASSLRAYPVSRAVNDPSNDTPSVVQKIDTPGGSVRESTESNGR
jgi:putative SOS response-associated peptidase YedK